MFKPILKNLNLLIVIFNLIISNHCLAFISEDNESTTAIRREIVDTNRRLRDAKANKVMHEKHNLTGFFEMDNKTIADLEEKKCKLEEELLLNRATNDNQYYNTNNTQKRLELSREIVDTNRRLKDAKANKVMHEKHNLTGFFDMDNRTIADLEEKKCKLEEELLLLDDN